MNEIIPAIMAKNYDELYEAMESVSELVPLVQIDVMDGKFVPNASWPYDANGELSGEHFADITAEKEGLPFWESMDVELDLMVKDIDANLEQWIHAGPKRIVLHIESLQNPEKAFEQLQSFRDAMEVGISLSNETSNDAVEKYLEGGKVDFIQCMGIARIGFQGSEFDSRVLQKIEYFHKKYPDMPIAVDGGVNEETIQGLKEAGATRFVCGSAVFGKEGEDVDIEGNIENLKSLVWGG